METVYQSAISVTEITIVATSPTKETVVSVIDDVYNVICLDIDFLIHEIKTIVNNCYN